MRFFSSMQMITFLVFNIIVTVINGVIIVLMTLALIFWSAAIEVYKENDCFDGDNACICNGVTYLGKIKFHIITATWILAS